MNLYLMCASVEHAEGMANWLKGHIGHVGVVICSQDDESVATAKACAKALGSHIADTRIPEDRKEIERIAMQSTDVLVVVDEPDSCLDGWCGKRAAPVVRWELGSVGLFDMADTDIVVICWIVTPEIVLPGQAIIEAARALTDSLKESSATTKKKVAVAAFSTVLSSGGFDDPDDVDEGDQLYIQRNSQPGAGSVSLAPSGMAFAVALASIAAGETETIKVSLNQKQWITSDDPCPQCEENAAQGWIDADETFDSGDDEPPAHPNCECGLETRDASDEGTTP
jgi:hypothetical protein